MTGVDVLIEKGIADPERMGLMGWSYGGYMSYWVVTHSDRFKAISAGAGLTNLISFYGTNDAEGARRTLWHTSLGRLEIALGSFGPSIHSKRQDTSADSAWRE